MSGAKSLARDLEQRIPACSLAERDQPVVSCGAQEFMKVEQVSACSTPNRLLLVSTCISADPVILMVTFMIIDSEVVTFIDTQLTSGVPAMYGEDADEAAGAAFATVVVEQLA